MSAPEDDEPGLLSRWSRRKAQARAGVALPEPAPGKAPVAPLADPPSPPGSGAPSKGAQVPEAQPLPTLADVAALDADGDFSRFVRPGVDVEVQRAAVKKLFFSDPRFNVMDGLDTYIEDYGAPDPIPESMLRRMVQSRLLGLLGPEEAPRADGPQVTPDGTAAAPLPQSPTAADSAALEPADEDPALRLQPDDAADAAGARADRPHSRA